MLGLMYNRQYPNLSIFTTLFKNALCEFRQSCAMDVRICVNVLSKILGCQTRTSARTTHLTGQTIMSGSWRVLEVTHERSHRKSDWELSALAVPDRLQPRLGLLSPGSDRLPSLTNNLFSPGGDLNCCCTIWNSSAHD